MLKRLSLSSLPRKDSRGSGISPQGDQNSIINLLN